MKINYKTGITIADEDDRERAVLPTITYLQETHEELTAHGIAFGWWKWAVYLFIASHKNNI